MGLHFVFRYQHRPEDRPPTVFHPTPAWSFDPPYNLASGGRGRLVGTSRSTVTSGLTPTVRRLAPVNGRVGRRQAAGDCALRREGRGVSFQLAKIRAKPKLRRVSSNRLGATGDYVRLFVEDAI